MCPGLLLLCKLSCWGPAVQRMCVLGGKTGFASLSSLSFIGPLSILLTPLLVVCMGGRLGLEDRTNKHFILLWFRFHPLSLLFPRLPAL